MALSPLGALFGAPWGWKVGFWGILGGWLGTCLSPPDLSLGTPFNLLMSVMGMFRQSSL